MDVQLTYVPHPKQLVAHNARQKHILFGGAVGGGKSVALVNDALGYCLGWRGIRVGVFRWQFSEFRTTTYKTMEEWILGVHGLVRKHDQNAKEITIINGSQIVYGGLKPSEAAAGDIMSKIRSLELAAGYIDELQDVPEGVYDFWSSRMRRSRGVNARTGKIQMPPARCFNSCNPHLGWVKNRWLDQRRPGYVFIQSKVRDNIYQEPDYEADLRRDWADNESWIEQFLEGRWDTLVDFEAIYPADKLIAASKRTVKPGLPIVFGVDVGEYGNDKSIVIMREGLKGTLLWERKGQGTMALANQVSMLADRYNPEQINVDAIGVGAGVWDRLREMGYPAYRFISGGKADVVGFLNKRAQAFWSLRRLMMAGTVQLPNHSGLINEMGTIRYLRDASGRTIQVESKKALRKRLGHSPDYADACAYCFADAGWDFVSSGMASEL